MQSNDFNVGAVRQRLGLTPEALAAELYVTEGEVRGWEAGTVRVPGRMRQTMEYLVARTDWDAGLEASGLPACAWFDAALPKLAHAAGREQSALAKELSAHLAACETCKARNAWAREHLPPPPSPPAAGFGRVIEVIGRLPEWARPAAYGAIAVFLMTGFRILFVLPAAFRSPMRLLEALGVALLAAAGGAVGGFGYSLTRPPLARLGTPGDYLSGIVATASYMGAILAVAALLGEPMITDVPDLVIFALCSVLFGVIVGKYVHEAREAASPAG